MLTVSCVLCLKAEQQKHGLANLAVSVEPTNLGNEKISPFLLYFEKETTQQFQSRAPPIIS
jgi:hypothetical protein